LSAIAPSIQSIAVRHDEVGDLYRDREGMEEFYKNSKMEEETIPNK
jgi:translation initiation factor 2 beta subunit (eIF-2beta)/eIF-5